MSRNRGHKLHVLSIVIYTFNSCAHEYTEKSLKLTSV